MLTSLRLSKTRHRLQIIRLIAGILGFVALYSEFFIPERYGTLYVVSFCLAGVSTTIMLAVSVVLYWQHATV